MDMRSVSLVLLLAAAAASCDDGRIYDEGASSVGSEGLTVSMRGVVSGCADYDLLPQYSVALAAFRDGDDFAVSSKPVGDGNGDVVLSNIPLDVSTVEVCLIDRLRKRVATFASADASAASANTLVFDIGELDVAMFPAIQREVFSSTCTQCHGATGHAAASLDLRPEASYDDLVNAPSSVLPGMTRVVPGDADASVLWQTVATDLSASWAFNHANLLTDDKKEFIKNWINSATK